MRMFDIDNIFKLYDGQLNKLFNLGHITVKSIGIVFVYFKSPLKIRKIRFRSALFRFICKHFLRLRLSRIVLCMSIDVAQILIQQYEKTSDKLDQQISAAFLNMIDETIKNAPTLKLTEQILNMNKDNEECEKPWEAE